MPSDEFWIILNRMIDGEKTDSLINLSRGHMAHEGYKEMCGYLRGLQTVQNFASDVIKKINGGK